jgi:hypothetical protein
MVSISLPRRNLIYHLVEPSAGYGRELAEQGIHEFVNKKTN